MNDELDNWELCKLSSNYHWDPTVDDSDTVRIIANVYSQWEEEIDRIIPLQTPIIADKFEKHIVSGSHMYSSYIIDSTNANEFPLLSSIGQLLGIGTYTTSIQTQTTGVNTPLHIDTVKNQNNTVRVIVFLQDWYWGQILQFGNTYLHNWKAGDVLYFEIENTPHSTANCSPYPRTIAKITGNLTDQFLKLIE